MPRLPQLPKFRGDFTQSYEHWIKMFEVQLKVTAADEDRYKNILLCCCEDAAFRSLSNLLAAEEDTMYDEMKETLSEKFCGDEYKRTLQTKLRNMKFQPPMKVTTFINDLCRIIKELYSLNDNDAVKMIATNHVLSTLDNSIREEVKILLLTGNLQLENLLEFIDYKMQRNLH